MPAERVAFSSDPGSLFSGDDFYVMSSGLAMLETTIGNNNATLYAEFVRPNTVLEWVRNVVANRLAASGEEWASIYSRYNSGTCVPRPYPKHHTPSLIPAASSPHNF